MKNILLKKKFVSLRAEGVTLRKIAESLGISYPTAFDWNKKLQFQVQDLSSFLFDELKEKLCISRKHSLYFLSEQFEKVKKEIDKTGDLQLYYDDLMKVALSIIKEADKLGPKPAPVISSQCDDIDEPEEDNDRGDKTLSND